MRKTIWMIAAMVLLMAALPFAVAFDNSRVADSPIADRQLAKELASEPEAAQELIPETYETAEALANPEDDEVVGSSTRPLARRYLLWTHDGVHVMWGWVANGYFAGNDNDGATIWGIYGNGFFAGFYMDGGDREFFYGQYRGSSWKATGLFGEEETKGRFVLFPRLRPRPIPMPVPGLESVEVESPGQGVGKALGQQNWRLNPIRN
ncbi:MAG: hypothetical protein ABIC95_01405 [archaeon]